MPQRSEWLTQVKGHLLFGLPSTLLLIGVIALALKRTRRLYEEETRRHAAEDALKQAQRLEALGQLTGGVAHDFNNILMVIGGATQKLKRLEPQDKQLRSLEMIELAVQKGESLTKKLLSFSRKRTLAPQVIDLSARINALRGVLAQSISGDIALELNVPNEVIAVRVDPSEFEIALLNLTLNARDAMVDGGRLVVMLQRVSERSRLPNGLDGAFAMIAVSDSGSGIADHVREHIFEPFFTTKPMDKGTGLGLSQVYGFVTQAHGAVTVDSSVGRGSVFTLYLPIVDETPETASPSVAPDATRLERKRVLLVEDNADVACIATEYLEQCGCNVMKAANAAIAVATLNEQKDIDIVFSDIAMPGMNGLELARLVRDHHPEIAIVLASGYSEKAAQAVREGFRVIEKPYSADAMQQSLMAVAVRR